MPKYKVMHQGVICPAFIVEPNDPPLPIGKGYEIKHRGIPVEHAADVVEQFRAKHGRIQTNHPYVVETIASAMPVESPPLDINSIPAGFVRVPAEFTPMPLGFVPVESEGDVQPIAAVSEAQKPSEVATEPDGMRIEEGLSVLELPSEISSRLINAGITTVEQVMECDELTAIKGIEAEDAALIYASLEKATE